MPLQCCALDWSPMRALMWVERYRNKFSGEKSSGKGSNGTPCAMTMTAHYDIVGRSNAFQGISDFDPRRPANKKPQLTH